MKESITKFLGKRLRLKVNEEKSAVGRPWERKFLGYTMTWHREPRLKVSEVSVKRLKMKLREILRRGTRAQHWATNRGGTNATAERLDELLPAGRGEGNLRGAG